MIHLLTCLCDIESNCYSFFAHLSSPVTGWLYKCFTCFTHSCSMFCWWVCYLEGNIQPLPLANYHSLYHNTFQPPSRSFQYDPFHLIPFSKHSQHHTEVLLFWSLSSTPSHFSITRNWPVSNILVFRPPISTKPTSASTIFSRFTDMFIHLLLKSILIYSCSWWYLSEKARLKLL